MTDENKTGRMGELVQGLDGILAKIRLEVADGIRFKQRYP